MKTLSDLQKKIIELAHRKPPGGYVSNRDVLRDIYGYPVYGKYTENIGSLLADQGSSMNEYKSASVSIAKSFNRLCDRGLTVRKYNSGVALTDKGAEVARSISG